MAPRRQTQRPITEAVIYARISRDKEGEEMGVQRQEKACRERAANEGWTITRVYVDNDISASSRSKKVRPEFEEMMAAAEAGTIGCIMAYSNSRLTRRPAELERLITAHDATGVQFRTVVSGDDDLSKAEGRMVARIKGNIDTAESDKISERVAAAVRQRAEQGRIHGRVAFGYEAVTGPDGKVASWRHHPEHAAWVREAAKRVLAGESLYGICNDWNGKGRLTGNRVGWRSRMIKRMLTSPAVAGLRDLGDGEMVEATMWRPILKRSDWDRLRIVLGDEMHRPRPFVTGKTSAKSTLVGLVYCGTCGCALSSMPLEKADPGKVVKRAMGCNKQAHPGREDEHGHRHGQACGTIRIAMESLELWVTEQFFETVDSPAFRAAVAADPEDDQQSADLRDVIEQDERRLEQIDTDHYDGTLDRESWKKQRQRVLDRVETNRGRLSHLMVRASAPQLPGADVLRRQWATRDAAWRRSMLSTVVEKVEILPYPIGMTTHLSRRRGETDEELDARRTELLVAVLEKRVVVRWRH